MQGLGLQDVASQGYCFQVDLARRAIKAGYHVVEVPITFVERELGDSKMSRDILVEALWRVTTWGVGERVGKVLGRDRQQPGGRSDAAAAERAEPVAPSEPVKPLEPVESPEPVESLGDKSTKASDGTP